MNKCDRSIAMPASRYAAPALLYLLRLHSYRRSATFTNHKTYLLAKV